MHKLFKLPNMYRGMDKYRYAYFRKDLASAFSVAMLALPQSMAYALVAGLPPIIGVISAIFATLACGIFGSSRHLVSGPTNSVAILLQSAIAEIIFTYYRGIEGPEKLYISLQIVAQVALLVGILQALSGVLRLGTLTQFVSRSVVVGYVTGTAIAVIIEQMFFFTGMPRMEGLHALYVKAWYFLSNIAYISWPTLTLGMMSLILIYLFRKIHPSFPSSLLVLGLMTGLVFISESFYPLGPTADSIQQIAIVKDIGGVSPDAISFSMPIFNIEVIGRLLPAAFAIALLGMLESSSISKTIAVKTGQRISINKEVFGLGLGNICSSIFGGMPASGSLSRSVMNLEMGAKTRFSAILSAIVLFGMILLFSKPVSYIPLATLSALLFIAIAKVIDRKQFLVCVRSTRSDALVLFMTFGSCILFGLDVAFYIGIVLSITLYLKSIGKPSLTENLYDDGTFRPVKEGEYVQELKIRIIHVEGELFFGASDLFMETLRTTAMDKDAKVIILRLKYALHIDATTCIALSRIYNYLNQSGRYLLACGVTRQVYKVLKRSGFVDELGEENIFLDSLSQYGSSIKAYERAKELIQCKESADPTCEYMLPKNIEDISKDLYSPSSDDHTS